MPRMVSGSGGKRGERALGEYPRVRCRLKPRALRRWMTVIVRDASLPTLRVKSGASPKSQVTKSEKIMKRAGVAKSCAQSGNMHMR